MAEQRERSRRVEVFALQELLRTKRPLEQPLVWPRHGAAVPGVSSWQVVASEEEYEPLPQQVLEAVVLHAGLADLLSRMESLERTIGSATEQMAALGKRVAALEERLAEQGVVRNAMLCDLGREGYSLRCPITVVIEEYDEETVARLPEVEAFASAATEPEALTLLKEDIVGLYEDLISTPEEQLGALPRQWRAVLLRLIDKHGTT
jgi:hypothetical protein